MEVKGKEERGSEGKSRVEARMEGGKERESKGC